MQGLGKVNASPWASATRSRNWSTESNRVTSRPSPPVEGTKNTPAMGGENWRRHPDSNWGITILQTVALPLGYAASGLHRMMARRAGVKHPGPSSSIRLIPEAHGPLVAAVVIMASRAFRGVSESLNMAVPALELGMGLTQHDSGRPMSEPGPESVQVTA